MCSWHRRRDDAVLTVRVSAEYCGTWATSSEPSAGSIQPGTQLVTPGQSKPFEVAEIRPDGIVLLPSGRHDGVLRCHGTRSEGLADLLRGRGVVTYVRHFDLDDDVTTPSGYLKQFTKRQPSNWIMVVLERAGVVELDRGRPIKARLMAGY